MNPGVVTDDVLAAAWCPTDGYIRPLEILRGFTEAARRQGAVFTYGAEVVAGRARPATASRRWHLRTGESVACGAVVNAAGAWAAGVGALAGGRRCPWRRSRRQVAMTVPTDALPPDGPDDDRRRERLPPARARGPRALRLAHRGRWQQIPVEHRRRARPGWPRRRGKAGERVPALAGVPVDPARCWAGLYELSPDKLAILGAADECPNLFLINGSSGHGVMHAPALGQLLAEIIVPRAGRRRST